MCNIVAHSLIRSCVHASVVARARVIVPPQSFVALDRAPAEVHAPAVIRRNLGLVARAAGVANDPAEEAAAAEREAAHAQKRRRELFKLRHSDPLRHTKAGFAGVVNVIGLLIID